MNTQPWMQVLDGAAFPLVDTLPMHVNFRRDHIALARQPRFCGHAQRGDYSVAQHSVVVSAICRHLSADLTCDEKRRQAELAGLIHDFHEAYMGDITKPAADRLAAIEDERLEAFATAVRFMVPVAERGTIDDLLFAVRRRHPAAVQQLKNTLDGAIYPAAGLAWPLAPEIAAIVHRADAIALETERRTLLAEPATPWGDEAMAVWPHPIHVLSEARAAEQWWTRFSELTEF